MPSLADTRVEYPYRRDRPAHAAPIVERSLLSLVVRRGGRAWRMGRDAHAPLRA